jgi:hypothetical protein
MATSHAVSMITAIISAEKYSILPCPYGCSLSGFLLESLVPMIVMVEESTSLRLFNASSIIAIELDRNHTIALKITKTMFVMIQYILTLIICFSLCMIIFSAKLL